MSEIDKAIFAIEITNTLLPCGEKIKAIALIMKLYNTDIKEAKMFVDKIQALSEPTRCTRCGNWKPGCNCLGEVS